MKNVLKRIYDLIIKLISVKGVLFIAFLVLAFQIQSELSITLAFFAGLLCVGLRTVEKFLPMIERLKDATK
jgi:hypothetical protein